MGNEPLVIKGFADAVGAAMGIKDRFGHGHGAALLDDDGVVLDLTLFTADEHTVDTALGWAYCFVLNHPHTRRLVLLSAVRDSVRTPREDVLAVLRRARDEFAHCGVEIVDWIQSDGDDIRSVAFTAEPDAGGSAA
ncbi:MAG: hypothetical protein ACT4PI_01970 [Actinomycetota bacterium]